MASRQEGGLLLCVASSGTGGEGKHKSVKFTRCNYIQAANEAAGQAVLGAKVPVVPVWREKKKLSLFLMQSAFLRSQIPVDCGTSSDPHIWTEH